MSLNKKKEHAVDQMDIKTYTQYVLYRGADKSLALPLRRLLIKFTS